MKRENKKNMVHRREGYDYARLQIREWLSKTATKTKSLDVAEFCLYAREYIGIFFTNYNGEKI